MRIESPNEVSVDSPEAREPYAAGIGMDCQDCCINSSDSAVSVRREALKGDGKWFVRHSVIRTFVGAGKMIAVIPIQQRKLFVLSAEGAEVNTWGSHLRE